MKRHREMRDNRLEPRHGPPAMQRRVDAIVGRERLNAVADLQSHRVAGDPDCHDWVDLELDAQ